MDFEDFPLITLMLFVENVNTHTNTHTSLQIELFINEFNSTLLIII